MKSSFETAILFLLYNRPDKTSKVFEKIKQIKPSRLYVASDGPREGSDSDRIKVLKSREIASKIDWHCELKTLYRDKNLGCKKGVSSAITWFFENEEQGIILEDDCVPHLDFFIFCEDLLNRYSDDERILAITGNNFQNGNWRGDASFYFSKFAHCWGWATWRRSWKQYDPDIKFWSKWSNSKDWINCVPDKIERRYWQKIFDCVHADEIDSWAYPWTASMWYKNGLSITPNVNLVSNIGFGENATHTKSKYDKNANMITSSLKISQIPKFVQRDMEADRWTFDHHYNGKYLRFPNNWIFFPKRVLNYILRKINYIKKNI